MEILFLVWYSVQAGSRAPDWVMEVSADRRQAVDLKVEIWSLVRKQVDRPTFWTILLIAEYQIPDHIYLLNPCQQELVFIDDLIMESLRSR